jgi:TetR/AcrR family transcriptional regulator
LEGVSFTEVEMTESPSTPPAPDGVVRERLLTAATALFARKGYAATTTREIVAAAGVTKPVLYYYFKNKEGLYLDMMGRAFKEFDLLLNASLAGQEKVTTRIATLCDRVLALVMERIDVARVMYSIYYGPHQGAPFFDFDGYHLRLQEAVRRLVVEGIETGELRRGDPGDMTWTLLGALTIVMENELSHPERGLGRGGLSRILGLLFGGLATIKNEQEEA